MAETRARDAGRPGRRARRPVSTAAEWAVRLCDRHRGIGGDGVVLHAVNPRDVGGSLRALSW